MGECGCTGNDDRYLLPGPKKSFYLISLTVACKYCDAPPGITIEHITPEHALYREYKRGEFNHGLLKFNDWPEGPGLAIVTGLRQHEFVQKMLTHLAGTNANDIGENGVIDEIGAEVLLEEMYSDSCVQPHLVTEEPNDAV